MSQYQNNPALDKLTLGKKTAYYNQYDPSLLQAVPRSLNRDPLNIHAGNLPFMVLIFGPYMSFLG